MNQTFTLRAETGTCPRQSFVRCRRCRRPGPAKRSSPPLFGALSALFYKCGHCEARSLKIPKTVAGLVSGLAVLCTAGALLFFSPYRSAFPTWKAEDVGALNRSRLAAYEQLSLLEQTTGKPNPALNNATVLKFWKDKVDPAVIVQMVRLSPSSYDLSLNGVTGLRRANLDPAILDAMLFAARRDADIDEEPKPTPKREPEPQLLTQGN